MALATSCPCRRTSSTFRAIERNGLSETTGVAYSSNHGGNVGARGMSGKSTRYDVAAGVPLIPAGPHVP